MLDPHHRRINTEVCKSRDWKARCCNSIILFSWHDSLLFLITHSVNHTPINRVLSPRYIVNNALIKPSSNDLSSLPDEYCFLLVCTLVCMLVYVLCVGVYVCNVYVFACTTRCAILKTPSRNFLPDEGGGCSNFRWKNFRPTVHNRIASMY